MDLIKLLTKSKTFQSKLNEIVEDLIVDGELGCSNLKPTSKSNHVGIEIECYSSWDKSEIIKEVIKLGLFDKVSVVEDGSLNGYDGVEFRVIDTEKNILATMKKVGKLLKKIKANVDDDCGLHVHLDMRNRDYKQSFIKLVKAQDVLYSLVDKSRHFNSFCQKTLLTDINTHDRYKSINPTSYRKHKTIEVRLHEGTVDVKKIMNWVNLLINIIKNKSVKKYTTFKQQEQVYA